MKKKVVIIGAGPAGITAAFELSKNKNFEIFVFEADSQVGGISKTVNCGAYRIDLGGHRFFSKNSMVVDWWKNIFTDKRQLLDINRKSSILFDGSLFDYPLKLNIDMLLKLGFIRSILVGMSYIRIKLKPIADEKSLEDYVVNRFGNYLYRIFFKEYTEKVWGVQCSSIPADWGKQRIRGVSIAKVILDALKPKNNKFFSNKNVETSLIRTFLYPKYGPGQLWSLAMKEAESRGVKLRLESRIKKIQFIENSVESVVCFDLNGDEHVCHADYFISTMPIKDLVNGFCGVDIPEDVKEVANGLLYRDFIIVALCLDRHSFRVEEYKISNDNWIYIQDKKLKVGRIQIFNNWSEALVDDPNMVCLGLEYFCNEEDELWKMSDKNLINLAVKELEDMKLIEPSCVDGAKVIRVPKAYPAYFGSYSRFPELRTYLDKIDNLYLIGRNGMHRYNNMDHSMLSAMAAVDIIVGKSNDKNNIWEVNSDYEYHENKK